MKLIDIEVLMTLSFDRAGSGLTLDHLRGTLWQHHPAPLDGLAAFVGRPPALVRSLNRLRKAGLVGLDGQVWHATPEGRRTAGVTHQRELAKLENE